MIKTKDEYYEFLKVEQRYSGFWQNYSSTLFRPTLRFLLLLRTCEYLRNAKTGYFWRMIYHWVKYQKYQSGIRLGFSIPENVVGKGLQLPHYGTIVINAKARLGEYCRIHACVNIGASGGGKKAPQIGDQVYIGPGAKIYGEIEIADRIAIAANAAVGKSFHNSDCLIGGVPAKEIGGINIDDLIKFGENGLR